jgi:alpha-ribazole phosphatase
MKNYRINFIRHGITQANLEGLYVGRTDHELCTEGIRQLINLRENCLYPEVQRIYSSPLTRCVQTAGILYPDQDPVIVEGLVELDFGEFDGKTAEELENHPLFAKWLSGDPEVDPPFGENQQAFGRRICAGFEKIIDGMLKSGIESTAVVTHGGVIMQLMARYALPEASAHEWITPSGCGYTLSITPSVWMNGRKLEASCEIPEPERDFDYERMLWGQEPIDSDLYDYYNDDDTDE